MAVLIASNLRKELAGDPLFDGVSFGLERRDRLALAGPNGAGKTTLLRMIVGETSVDGGELALEKGTRIALHDQRPPLDRALSLREYVLSGASDLVATERELRRLEEAMAAGAADPDTLAAYARAQARLEHAGGYAWREHANAVLRGLGFSDGDLDRALTTFSGGEITRASLARSLAGDPDLLLLDEPTNHLDVASLEWLERELASLDAACVVVAHDRWFLEAVTNATLELEAGRATYFPGPWHVWRREKAERAVHAQKTADRVAADIARLERFVARFRYKKSKAKQAQAKLTHIGRLEKERAEAAGEAALLTRRTRGLGFEFGEPRRSGRDVLVLEGEEVSVGGRVLLRDVSLAVERGEHVALVGPNGSGKTTLIEQAVAGRFKLGYGVDVGYFSQQGTELDERGSVLDCVQAMTGLPRPRAQRLLGRFLFSGWEAHMKRVRDLSGGERRRLGLAVLVASGSNFLVLDEPTNHLDLDSREALEAALESFPGTILLVSHDRALLDAVAERTAAIEDGTLRVYDGGWADLVRAREEREEAAREARPRNEPKRRPAKEPKGRPEKEPKRPTDRLARIEAEIERRERDVAALEERLAADWTDVDTIAAHKRAREELERLLARWEAMLEEVTNL
ncbi:MAG TPA: ABC-F family ATP-binding cassette domain-containing protein [Gaiellaceae bacterium]|nr:ABC-F family ATP-binding cassette domain-containing protein [Gaiellaceae bacterium]